MCMKTFYKDKDFDFSEYPENLKFYDKANKKLIGKINDETKGALNVECVTSK